MASPVLPRRQGSLARSTLIKMGVRIGVIIALTTLFSYVHMFRSIQSEVLVRLERYVLERSQREEAIFVLAQDNQALLKKALEERLQAWEKEDPDTRFNSLFETLPDGTTRSRREGFDSTKLPGVFVPQGVPLEASFRRKMLAAHDVLVQYGPAYRVRFSTTYITLPEGAVLGYWPEAGTWANELDTAYSIFQEPFFLIGLPQNNPSRRAAWSGVFWDVATNSWVATATTPLDQDQRHLASISHDVLLAELMARSINDRLSGSYNVIFREDGQLLAHPDLTTANANLPYNILRDTKQPQPHAARIESPEKRAHLHDLFEQVVKHPGQSVLELSEHGEYLAAKRLEGTGWYFVTVLDEHEVSVPAFQGARFILLLGVLSLLMELVIMSLVLRQQITRPLVSFTQATDQVAAGNFKVALDTSRDDELGRLSHAFQVMAQEVQHREEALRQANQGLEQRVEERTHELKEAHKKLVDVARQSGMAEIATNVLHNVGNVLNSIHTSVTLAKNQLTQLRLEQVTRVASMFQERKADLSVFLTTDERGRKLTPYLLQLGENLVEERQRINTLLEEVDQYTAHIGTIVKLQQDYARAPSLNELVRVEDLVQDALRMQDAALSQDKVKVELQLASLPPLLLDKHKALMVLVNLISNARHAMAGTPESERRLTIQVEPPVDGRIRLEVRDNGVGIAPEMLTRIFQRGFTTRSEGHGFGLHSSALAAQHLSGTLSAHSEGPGKGATFTLELPYQTQEEK
jgi:two-component system, NtrC family, sensor kinase